MTMRVFPGWWQVAAALILQAASSASVFTAYSIVAVPLQETFEPSRMMLMMGITAAALASGSLSPIAGAAVDRFSVRLLMLAGTIILGSGFFLLSFVTSMTQVVLVYLIPLSLASVLIGPVAGSALLARWFTRRRGFAMGLAASGSAVGGLFIPPLLQFLIDSYEWRMALQLYGAGLTAVTLPIVALLVINRPADRQLHPDGDREPPPSTGHPVQALTTADVLRNRNFWLIVLSIGVLLGGPMALVSNLLPLLLEKGITATQGAMMLSFFSAAGFTGKLVFGYIADRLDFRLIMAGIVVAMGISFFAYTLIDSYAMLVLFGVLMAGSQGGLVPIWSLTMARMYGPANVGRSMGLASLLIMPFTLVGPPLFGWVFDLSGSYNNALIGYTVLLVLPLVFIAMVRQDQAREQPQPAASAA